MTTTKQPKYKIKAYADMSRIPKRYENNLRKAIRYAKGCEPDVKRFVIYDRKDKVVAAYACEQGSGRWYKISFWL